MDKKILVCDDDVDLIKVVVLRLRSAGYQVVWAADGMQSVSKAHQERPDLILLDFNMPGLHGGNVVQRLKLSTDTMIVPILLFSAMDPLELEKKAAELQVAGYISKPYEIEALLAKIKAVLDS